MMITAQAVKELRERTGAGMMDCKKALEESQGDLEAAILAMRKAGKLKAAKKAGRVAAEGIVIQRFAADHHYGIQLELNCETDFVAKDANFVQFATQLIDYAVEHRITSVDGLLNSVSETGATFEQVRLDLVTKIGENVQLRRLAELQSTGSVNGYVHSNHRIAVLVAVEKPNAALAKDVAMHIAAMNPSGISAADVPAELIAREREVYWAQAQESGKSADILQKMVDGRIQKYLKESTLLEQAFVKDPEQTVGQLLTKQGNRALSFVRFEVGEGIEKQVQDFAGEVMAQVKKSSEG